MFYLKQLSQYRCHDFYIIYCRCSLLDRKQCVVDDHAAVFDILGELGCAFFLLTVILS